MFFTGKRVKHFAAMVLVGDGLLAVVRPEHDALAWKGGPKLWKEAMQFLHDRPALTRAIGVAQVVGGVWWALQQEKN